MTGDTLPLHSYIMLAAVHTGIACVLLQQSYHSASVLLVIHLQAAVKLAADSNRRALQSAAESIAEVEAAAADKSRHAQQQVRPLDEIS